MKIEIKPPISALLRQLPPDTIANGDAYRMRALRLCLDTLRGPVPEGLVANVFHDDACAALAEGITDAMRDIIRAAMPKVDGRRRPAEAAQALNAMQTFQGRAKALKSALTAYKKIVVAAHSCSGPEARGRLMRPAFEPVTHAFNALLDLQPPSSETRATIEDMKETCEKLERGIEMYATTDILPFGKSDGPASSPNLARWIASCDALTTQTQEAIRNLKSS